jgi:hypothetical protein
MDFRVLDDTISAHAPRGRHRFPTVAVAVLFLMALTAETALAGVNPLFYGGYSAIGQKQGIRGYILQPDSGTINAPNALLSWIGLCANNCAFFNYYNGDPDGPVFVQLGMYQGVCAAGTSTTSVHVYYENMTPCGDYHADDVGIPVSNPYWFRGPVQQRRPAVVLVRFGLGTTPWLQVRLQEGFVRKRRLLPRLDEHC